MGQGRVFFKHVSFTYETAGSKLLEGLTFDLCAGWTGIVGANGAGKTTILKLATGELKPQQGSVQITENAIYSPQRTDYVPGMLDNLVEAADADACKIKGRLGIENEWLERWETLSHGERKRAQIGVVLWRQPSVLAVDEPTNHLDKEARDMVAGALRTYKGVGLLVSHDRELLDGLCWQCIFVEPPGLTIRPGGYTKASQQAKKDEEYLRKQLETAKRARKKLEREVTRRRTEASRADRKRSKRGLDRKNHDARDKIDRARVTGRDAVAGKLLRQLEGRLRQAIERHENIKPRKTYDMGIWMPGSLSKRNALFKLEASSIHLGGDRWLKFPDLNMRPDDRIALTGSNGVGKSTLVRHITCSLNIPDDRLAYVPQEVDLTSTRAIMDHARGLPKDELGRMMAVVSRLGSRPERLLESTEPSPGEIRKILLATQIAHGPQLIIMDEPTNHLDLPSIECLENALDDCPCGLLLVSHDPHFLTKLTRTRWHISPHNDSPNAFVLRKPA